MNVDLHDIVLAAIEREQQRISEELHEKLCQTLAGISIQVDVLAHSVRNGKNIVVPDLEELGTHIQQVIDQTRSVARSLESAHVHGAGFMQAIDDLAQATAKEVRCEYICEKPVFVRDGEGALALYRLAQEAVRNALKHAAPTEIVISLSRADGHVTLEVRDDGRGFPAGRRGAQGIGAKLMRRYARVAGAELKIKSESGRGTIVSCSLPQGE
jgi:signal transduction histidine kinase